MLKKCLLGMLCILVTGAVFAGGNAASSGDSGKSNPILLRYGNSYAPDHPTNVASKKFIEIVEQKTNGKIKFNFFPGGQLGSDRAQAEGTIMGTQDMVLIGSGGISEFSPRMGIGECPFIWRDVDHMNKVLEGDIGKELTDELLTRRGLRVLTFLYYGSRNVTSYKPVKSPADMKGFRLRTPTVPILVAMARSWGAEPTPMDLGELYMALQTNVVDGQENPVPTIATNKLNEVQKYLILTRHVMTPGVLIISERKFKELGEENQKIVMEAAKEAKVLNDKLTIEREGPEAINALKMELIQPDIEAFRRASKDVHLEFEEVWGKGLYDKIVNFK